MYTFVPFTVCIVSITVHNPMTTPSRSTTTKWMLDIRTTPWKERQLRTSAAHLAIIQSPVITTETYRSVTLNRHTSSQTEVLTSSNRPVQEVVYKNPSVHRSPPSSSTASDLNHQHRPTGQLMLMTSMIAILTQVISFVSCWKVNENEFLKNWRNQCNHIAVFPGVWVVYIIVTAVW